MELAKLREQIDKTDKQLLELFRERMELSRGVAQSKLESGTPLTNRAREREILARVAAESGEDAEYACRLFETLFELSKARQSEIISAASRSALREKIENALLPAEELFPRGGTVACQGTEGGNSQAACDRLLPRGSIVYVRDFRSVFDAVAAGMCEFGVLPVENSTNGSVRGVYDMLCERGMHIVRAVSMPIRHALLAKKGVGEGTITTIYSHQQAFGQCSRFVASLGGNVRVVPCGNTAEAARMAAQSEERGAAAIAAPRCAELCGLDVVREDVADSGSNVTRFVCIAKDLKIYAGADRIGLVLECENRAGALSELLATVAAHSVNMSKLESCPVPDSAFDTRFIVELEASVRDSRVVAMLEQLERSCRRFELLGCWQSSGV